MVSKRVESPISSHSSGDNAPTRVFSEEAHGNVVVDDCLASIRRLEFDPNSIVIFVSGLVGSRHKTSRSAAGVVFASSSPSNISERLPTMYPKTVPIAEFYALRLALDQFLWLSRNDINLWHSPKLVATERTSRNVSLIAKDLHDNTQSAKDDIKSNLEHIENNENTQKEPGDQIDNDTSDDTSEVDSEGFLIDLRELQEKNELETDADMREALRKALHEAVQGAIHRKEDTEFQKYVETVRAKIEEMIALFECCNLVGNILKEIDALREVCNTPFQPAPTTKRFGISRVVIVTECEEVMDTFCDGDLNELLKGPSRKAMRKGAEFAKEASQKEALKKTIMAQIEGKEEANWQSFKELMETKKNLENRLTILYKLQNYKIYMKEMERVKKVAEDSGRTAECERRLVELTENICKSMKEVEKLCQLEFWLVGEDTIHEARDLANQTFSSKHDFGAKQRANYERLDNLGPEERRNIGENL